MLDRKEKRKRRTALEIERKYRWKYQGCPKSYGSEGSLNQHMKNKHTEFYHQFVENLGLSSGMVENSKYEDSSDYSQNSPDENDEEQVTPSESQSRAAKAPKSGRKQPKKYTKNSE